MRETDMPETCLVIITCGTRAEARRIGRQLVEDRLAACASVGGEIESIFRWQGSIEEETEVQLMLKTQRSHVERIAGRVEELHSYDLPEVVALPIVDGLGPYIQWIEQETEEADY